MKTKKYLNIMAIAMFCCMTAIFASSCEKKLTTTLKCSPNKVEVAVGKTASVSVKGGTTPYTVSSQDEATTTASLAKNKLTIKGVKAGTTTVTVTDKEKKTCTVNVTVK